MTFNKTKIEWCDVTWNPVTGCTRGCSFCYARNIARRFQKNYGENFTPKFYPERLKDPVMEKKPKVIFVVSMGDLFGEGVPNDIQRNVINACLKAPQHTYIFLTKNPDGMQIFDEYPVQKNFWLGTSCGENLESWYRAANFSFMFCDCKVSPGIFYGKGWNAFLSIEPVKILPSDFFQFEHPMIKWMIIGTQTNPTAPPLYDVIQNIVDYGKDSNIPIFMKDSVKKDFPSMELLRQFPFPLTPHAEAKQGIPMVNPVDSVPMVNAADEGKKILRRVKQG